MKCCLTAHFIENIIVQGRVIAFHWRLMDLFESDRGPGTLVGKFCTSVYTLLSIVFYVFTLYLVCEAIGTAATPGLLCQPRVIVKMTVEK
jgi:hypothetical protein